MNKRSITPYHDTKVDALFDEAIDEMNRKEMAASKYLSDQARSAAERDKLYHVRSWLNKVYDVTEKELAAKVEVKERLFGMITNGAIDYSKDRVQSSSVTGQEQKTVAYAAASADVEKVENKIAGLIKERMELINKVDGSMHRTVLIHRYINLKKWGELAHEMDYSTKQAQRIFDEAIEKIAPIVEDYLKEKGGE